MAEERPRGGAHEQIQVMKSEKAIRMDAQLEEKMPLSMHVICYKAKRICKHRIADAGEGDPEKISCSLETADGK